MNSSTRCLVVALALGATGCFNAPAEDAGELAFVAFATTTVLGRRPHSLEEVRALAQVEADLGRVAMLEVLMAQPEFVDHWSRVLMDDLLVWRTGNERAGDTSCYLEGGIAESAYSDLVDHLRTAGWADPFCPDGQGGTPPTPPDLTIEPELPSEGSEEVGSWIAAGDVEALETHWDSVAAGTGVSVVASNRRVVQPDSEGLDVADDAEPGFAVDVVPVFGGGDCDVQFTMADVLRASLSEDRMDALLRAGIAPQATFTAGTSNERGASQFLLSYLNRDLSCVQCHSSQYSTTSATPRNDHWDRFEPATPVALETGVFSFQADDGWYDGALGGNDAYQQVVRLFRTDQWVEEGGLQPFGMSPSCGVYSVGTVNNPTILRTGFASPEHLVPADNTASLAGLEGNTVGVLALVDQFRDGVNSLDWGALEPVPSPEYAGFWGESEFDLYCQDACHDGEAAPDFDTNAAVMTPARIHDIVAHGSLAGGMEPYPVYADAATAYFVGSGRHQSPLQYTRPEMGMAHLAAMQFVDHVFEEVSGGRLTTEAGFPRNPDAARTLDHLTTVVFVDGGWSLKALLVELLTSTHANRVAPADSFLDPYPLPMLVAPFADVNDENPDVAVGEDANGPGDLVHRWSTHSLLSQVQHALEWPEAPWYPSDDSDYYADKGFLRDLGARLNRRELGFAEHDLKAALAWEAEIASCRNDSDDASDDDDFVDRITDPSSDLTVGEAMLAVKERLVTSPQWWAIGDIDNRVGGDGIALTELGLATALSVGALSEPASSDPTAVRDFCAALLMSPQFLLAGLPSEVPVDGVTLVPCLDDQPCGSWEYCEAFAETAEDLGYGEVDCPDDPFDTITLGAK